MAVVATTTVGIVATGGAEALVVREVPIGPPAVGEAQVRHAACGVNFIDIYQRSGLYPLELPATLGNEAAGEVVAVGDGVEGVVPGDRVAYCSAGSGCYSSARNVPADKLVRLPGWISLQDAAGGLLKGLTAEMLARRCWPVLAGMSALVLAAAGGVGSLLCQWLRRLGANVVGVVGAEAKRSRAAAAGCAEVLVGYGDMARRVRGLVPGGVGVVYDSVGATTWQDSLACLSSRGCLVSYGNTSGPVPPFAPLELATSGSVYVTRPVLMHYVPDARSLRAAADALFGEIDRGLRLPPVKAVPLAEAAAAHTALEGRVVEGSLVLLP